MKKKITDLELLRKYEPVLRFTKGEIYFPTDIESYVKNCSLWVSHPNHTEEKIVPEGKLTIDKLTNKYDLKEGDVLFLRFVDLPSLKKVTEKLKEGRLEGRAKKRGWKPGRSRLARVGYVSRIIDALFSLTLLARGKVPGIVAAIAEENSAKINKLNDKNVYYGRVIRDNGWICLQYWYFYHYDDWRTSFEGVNDHEADWEMITVYLYEDRKIIKPRWVVFSCHDFIGDNLRRRWDDTLELEKIGNHPVAYVGAGSHASYYRPGEYLIESEVPFFYRITPMIRKINLFWQTKIRRSIETSNFSDQTLRIPFVEYARGDGISIGEKQKRKWYPVLISERTAWLKDYKGLWGLYTRDPIGGENAPAGPMYNRDETPRFSWYDPLGFAGLDKVATPNQEIYFLKKEKLALKKRQKTLEKEVQSTTQKLYQLGSKRRAFSGSGGKEQKNTDEQIKILANQNRLYRQEISQNRMFLEKITDRINTLKSGKGDLPQDHIQTLQKPTGIEEIHFARLTELWSAASIGFLLVLFMLILLFMPDFVLLSATILFVAFVIAESIFRGRFAETARTITVTLAIVAALILIWQFFWTIIIVGLLAGGVYLILTNVREALV